MLMVIILEPTLQYMGIRQKDRKDERDQNRCSVFFVHGWVLPFTLNAGAWHFYLNACKALSQRDCATITAHLLSLPRRF
jgi:hypothetical protein